MIGRNCILQPDSLLEGEMIIDSGETGAADIDQNEHDSQEKSSISDTVDDKRLLSGSGCRRFFEPETNQKIGTKAYSFPTDKHHNQICSHNKDKHGECEKV